MVPPGPRIELMSPALAGKFLTTRPPGNSLLTYLWGCFHEPGLCSMLPEVFFMVFGFGYTVYQLIFPTNLNSCKILQWKIYPLPDYMSLRRNVSTHSLLHDLSLNPTFLGSGTNWVHENFSYQSICYTYHYWKWKFYFLPPYVLSSLWSTLCWKTLLCFVYNPA